MDDQCSSIADIGQVRGEANRFDELAAGVASALDPEAQDRTRTIGIELLGQLMIGMGRHRRVRHPADGFVVDQHRDHRLRVLHVSFHTQWKGFDPLDDLERIHRADRSTEVAEALGSCSCDERSRAELLG